jgi:phosphoribosylanthranilate isomerase
MTRPWDIATPGRTLIKICGIRDEDTLQQAVDAGADAVGFVLAPGSPRSIDLDEAIRLADALPDHVTAVGVVVDAEPAIRDGWSDRWIQLHGREDEDIATGYAGPVIRAIPFEQDAVAQWDRCTAVDRLLIDAPDPGSGRAFDHAAFAALDHPPTTPVIVAGGLDPETVTGVIERLRPWAVDVSSGVESSPGVKDASRIIDFCRAVRDTDAP